MYTYYSDGDLRLVDNSGEQEAPLADWRSITVDNGGQCVMTASVQMMQEWLVVN